MRKNKKGAEMSLNVIIIAIIVIVVLLILATFFLGGFSNVANRIKNIFGGGVGTEREFAIQTCQQYCVTAQSSIGSDKGAKSAFCTHKFKIDENDNGVIDADEEAITCTTLVESCSGVICTSAETTNTENDGGDT